MRVRQIHILLLVLLFTGSLVSCQQPCHQPEERYVFVASHTSVPFWREAEAGLTDAAKQMGVKAELIGPANFSPDEELKAFQQAAAQKPSGILLSASNSEVFRAWFIAGINKGIRVIGPNEEVPDFHPYLLVVTTNFLPEQKGDTRR